MSYTNYTNIPKTFTTPRGANYIRFNCRHSDNASISPSDITQIQREEGSSATTYESPNPLKLCKIGDYQDYIYKSGDDWYVHKAIQKVLVDGVNIKATSYHNVNGGINGFRINISSVGGLGYADVLSDNFNYITCSIILFKFFI